VNVVSAVLKHTKESTRCLKTTKLRRFINYFFNTRDSKGNALDMYHFTTNQWRNDGVAAASCDGAPTGKGAPDSSTVLTD